MAKPVPMTLEEARAILHRWEDRRPGEHQLVIAADQLLEQAWRQRQEQQQKKAHRVLFSSL
jgi:hypothetical protein